MKAKQLLSSVSATALLAMLSGPATAQHTFLRKAGERHKSQMREMTRQAPRKAHPLIDEAQDWRERDDVRYRYVYAYDAGKQRSSETIYRNKREDGQWQGEQLLCVGTYTYEYDSHQRIKAKTVRYTANDDFESYRVMVSYGAETTDYQRYAINEDNSISLEEEWSYYPNGVMASHTMHHYTSESVARTFNETGQLVSERRGERGWKASGTLNDSTRVDYEDWRVRTRQFQYSPDTGKLLGYKTFGYNSPEKYEWEYDALGRLIRTRYYNNDGTEKGSSSGSSEEPEWVLCEQTDITYNDTRVYSTGNSWHDVFEFDGPVKTYRFWERNEESDVHWVQTMAFSYDASGKLLGITHNQTGDPTEMSTKIMAFTVDGNGHITATDNEELFYEADGSVSPYDYSKSRTEYIWQGEEMVKSVRNTFRRDMPGHEESYTDTDTYTYGSGSVKRTSVSTDSYDRGGTVYAEQTPGRYYEYYQHGGDSYGSSYKLFVETQQEDVVFTRPNIFKDMDGLTPDSTITASLQGRVVCLEVRDSYGNGWSSNYNYGYSYGSNLNREYYVNTTEDTYFSISHDGAQTICSTFDGLPVYVLEGGRLVKEYEYFDVSVSTPVAPAPSYGGSLARAAAVPAGMSYNEVTYAYNANGLLTGKSIVEVKEDGTRTEQIALEYRYDPSTAVEQLQADGRAGLSLTGRHLGLAGGATFSVFGTDGTQLASGVSTFTFAKAGVYIVRTANRSFKLSVH